MDITKNSRELGRFRKQEDYLENVVSVFSASIPVLGSIIDRFLVNSNNNYLRKRVYDLFHYLEEITEKIDHSLIDREYLYSEEFISLLYLILEKLRLTAKKEKINMFAFFMLNCTKKDNANLRQNNEEYLNLLSDLSLQEISVLSSLYKKQKDIKSTSHEEILKKVDKNWDDFSQKMTKKYETKDALLFTLKRLESKGLLSEITAGTSYPDNKYVINKSITHNLLRLISED